MDGANDGNESTEQVRVSFTTKFEEYKVPDTSIAVPLGLRRKGLSEVINHLLELENVVPFEFLVVEKNAFVRGTLEECIRDLRLSKEAVLKLEYSPVLREPEFKSEQKWPDWQACVDGGAFVASGSYDGSVHMSEFFESKSELNVIGKIPAHRLAVKSVKQFSSSFLVSASKDGTVKLFSHNEDPKSFSFSQMASCDGHKGSVEGVDGAQIGNFAVLISGGWDRTMCLWKVRLDEEQHEEDDSTEDKPPSKKSKLNTKEAKCALQEVNPSAVFQEHQDQVSCVCWEAADSPSVAFSGSWDHSIRAWDVVRECCTMNLNGNKVVTSISHNSEKNLVATGHSDHIVRIWDSRVTGDALVKLSMKSHSAWVSSVAWSDFDSNFLVSGSHDNTVKVWDIRSTIPLHTTKKHTNKVLGVACKGKLVLSAGADSSVKAYKLDL